MATKTLNKAKKEKNDEFYTRKDDVVAEMNAYLEYNKDLFRNKTVLCPCDDPEWSQFTQYFRTQFNTLGLKKLICTTYAGKAFHPICQPAFDEMEMSTERVESKRIGKLFVMEKGGMTVKDLKGDGDFRSEEVKRLRDEADFIVTNPPFSLFREFLPWIMDAGKQFAIIGNMNAITYKNVFPLIKENKIWLGATHNENSMIFGVPKGAKADEGVKVKFDNSMWGGVVKMGNTCWFTNIEHGRRHEPLTNLMTMADNLRFRRELQGKTAYDKYDNYDAIEVPTVKCIPSDYYGVMGVPISFLAKYCPEQFEIVGVTESEGKGFSNGLHDPSSSIMHPVVGGVDCTNASLSKLRIHGYKKYDRPYINGKRLYSRLIIRYIDSPN